MLLVTALLFTPAALLAPQLARPLDLQRGSAARPQLACSATALPITATRTAAAQRGTLITMGVTKRTIKRAPKGAKTPRRNDICRVHYIGRLAANGKEFDASRKGFGPLKFGEPFEFKLGAKEVIQGWDNGVAKMKDGETALLTISPDLAYGARGAGPIPPNSVLEFEVELIKSMTVDEYNAGA